MKGKLFTSHLPKTGLNLKIYVRLIEKNKSPYADDDRFELANYFHFIKS